jgi:hypothetical protein
MFNQALSGHNLIESQIRRHGRCASRSTQPAGPAEIDNEINSFRAGYRRGKKPCQRLCSSVASPQHGSDAHREPIKIDIGIWQSAH